MLLVSDALLKLDSPTGKPELSAIVQQYLSHNIQKNKTLH